MSIKERFKIFLGGSKASNTSLVDFDYALIARLCGVSDEYWSALYENFITSTVFNLRIFNDPGALKNFQNGLVKVIRANKGKVVAEKKDAIFMYSIVTCFCCIYQAKLSAKFEYHEVCTDNSTKVIMPWSEWSRLEPTSIKVRQRKQEILPRFLAVEAFLILLPLDARRWLERDLTYFNAAMETLLSLGEDGGLLELVSIDPFIVYSSDDEGEVNEIESIKPVDEVKDFSEIAAEQDSNNVKGSNIGTLLGSLQDNYSDDEQHLKDFDSLFIDQTDEEATDQSVDDGLNELSQLMSGDNK